MAECTICKAETQLYENGVPVCLACDEKRKPTWVRDTLKQQLQDATKRATASRDSFMAIASEVPSALPHPDGVQRLRNASQDLSEARREMQRANNRLNDFLADGTVPEDLKRGSGQ